MSISSGAEHEGMTFEGLDLDGADVRRGMFFECTFRACSFAGASFWDCRFIDCTFIDTDLAGSAVAGSSFRESRFERCRATGVDWSAADWGTHLLPGRVSFSECVLDFSSFLGAPLVDTSFEHCSLREADFSEADLTGARFSGADLTAAVFRSTDLRNADLRGATGYSIDVSINLVAGMRATLPDAMSLLEGLGIEVSDNFAVTEVPHQVAHTAAPEKNPSIVFLCVHNAGRSQMAAGFARHLGGSRVEVYSGGSDPAASVNPSAVAAMTEVGIDITDAMPQRWTDEIVRSADVVVTMGCGDTCPVFPGVRYEDWPLDDPAGKGVEDVLPIRDEIRRRVEDLLAGLGLPG